MRMSRGTFRSANSKKWPVGGYKVGAGSWWAGYSQWWGTVKRGLHDDNQRKCVTLWVSIQLCMACYSMVNGGEGFGSGAQENGTSSTLKGACSEN